MVRGGRSAAAVLDSSRHSRDFKECDGNSNNGSGYDGKIATCKWLRCKYECLGTDRWPSVGRADWQNPSIRTYCASIMKISDFLLPEFAERNRLAPPDPDPLVEPDALQEAQLLGIKFDATTGALGVLFDLRTALELRNANTGLLVARGVWEVSWLSTSRPTDLTAWTIGSSLPGSGGMKFSMWPAPGAQFSFKSTAMLFTCGDVPHLNDAPPNYLDLDASSVQGQLASWESEFEATAASQTRVEFR